MGYLPIEDYGIIGDMETVALVGKDGSIDWFCHPTLDSPSAFGALLDDDRGGRWRITPSGLYESSQRYLEHTNILMTEFTTAAGRAKIVDFMPLTGAGEFPEIIRIVTGIEGEVEINFELLPAFNYARDGCVVEAAGDLVKFTAGAVGLILLKPSGVALDNGSGRFRLRSGDSFIFQLYDQDRSPSPDPRASLAQTEKSWEDWAHRCESKKCPLEGEWHEAAVRSGLVLKLLTHRDSGSIAAAATTSLPESLDGDRNWDYRFSWLRDSVFTIQALLALGSVREALKFMEWLVELCKNIDPSRLDVLYRLHPQAQLEEEAIDSLSGYLGVGPVRIGNAASSQHQLDIYGELMRGVGLFIEHGGELEPEDWPIMSGLVDHVVSVWREPDAGIWEMRRPDQHYVYSKVMCWSAIKEGIKIANELGLADARLPGWRAVCDEITETVLSEGVSPTRQVFVQHFGSDNLDASNLLIPMTGFLPFTDERVVNTVEATMRELRDDGLVKRYDCPDSLSGREGAFLACSFWLVDCLVGMGRLEEAVVYFERVKSKANHLGLFSEEYDVKAGRMLGNFPQAFTHLALINSIMLLTNALAEPDGSDRVDNLI